MQGLLFIATCAAVFLVVRWSVRNDGAAADEPTDGLFALRDDTAAIPTRTRPAPRRRSYTSLR